MAGLGEVLGGVAARLKTIGGQEKLNVHEYPPDDIATPAAFVHVPDSVEYDLAGAGYGDVWNLVVTVVVSRALDRSYRDRLAKYIDSQGPASVKAVVEAEGTLGGVVDSTSVKRARPGPLQIAGIDYWAVEFDIEAVG